MYHIIVPANLCEKILKTAHFENQLFVVGSSVVDWRLSGMIEIRSSVLE